MSGTPLPLALNTSRHMCDADTAYWLPSLRSTGPAGRLLTSPLAVRARVSRKPLPGIDADSTTDRTLRGLVLTLHLAGD